MLLSSSLGGSGDHYVAQVGLQLKVIFLLQPLSAGVIGMCYHTWSLVSLKGNPLTGSRGQGAKGPNVGVVAHT